MTDEIKTEETKAQKPILRRSGVWAALATALATITAMVFGFNVDATVDAFGSIAGGILALVSVIVADKVD